MIAVKGGVGSKRPNGRTFIRTVARIICITNHVISVRVGSEKLTVCDRRKMVGAHLKFPRNTKRWPCATAVKWWVHTCTWETARGTHLHLRDRQVARGGEGIRRNTAAGDDVGVEHWRGVRGWTRVICQGREVVGGAFEMGKWDVRFMSDWNKFVRCVVGGQNNKS